jgi:GMP synthase PP-ATPase subunit
MSKEITAQGLDPEAFIREKVRAIREAVGDGQAINALSGGVDSSTVTMLGHRALGDRLRTIFVENGLMRAGEAEQVVERFAALAVKVEVVDACTVRPTRLPFELLEDLAREIVESVPGVVSVTYNIATKPPSTIEAV